MAIRSGESSDLKGHWGSPQATTLRDQSDSISKHVDRVFVETNCAFPRWFCLSFRDINDAAIFLALPTPFFKEGYTKKRIRLRLPNEYRLTITRLLVRFYSKHKWVLRHKRHCNLESELDQDFLNKHGDR